MVIKSKLKTELSHILPKGCVLTEKEECYVYSQDGTNGIVSDIIPDAVVFPQSIQEVQDILKYANENKIPVVARGAGTNLVGACIPKKGGIVISFVKMNKIIEINKINMTAKVQPGVVIDDLQKAVKSIGLFFPPDPSNLKVSTIGGAIAQSAGGPKTFKYGTTKDYVLGMKVVLADGTLINVGSDTIKNASGYHLEQLFIGSEGTLGIVVEATLKLIPKPETTRVILAYFDSVSDATDSVTGLIENNIYPSTIDFMDKNTLLTVERFYNVGFLTNRDAALIIEVDGFEIDMDYQFERLETILKSYNACEIVLSHSKEEQDRIWTGRRASFGAAAKLRPDILTNDIIVPREKISELIIGITDICKKYNLQLCIVGHIGDGNLHPQVALDMNNVNEVENYKLAKNEMYSLTVELGGAISAEHGIGLEKKQFFKSVVSENSLEYMKKIKKIFDPNNILNPDKIFDL